MSVWKNAQKSNQKTHRERHQPEERKHLGLLEKKKDYLLRAKDYNEKKATLRLLKKRALDKNPDEFYHHMINSKIEDGKHFELEQEDEDTKEQVKLMQTQDLKYITFKRTQEQRKIDKLQSQLHLTSVSLQVQRSHKVFPKNLESEEKKEEPDYLATTSLPDVDIKALTSATETQKRLYRELSKRIQREKELSVIQDKLEMKRHTSSKAHVLKPKLIERGTKDTAPVWKWKYERKK
ncbi:PREDICTED: probable U3 small nucleolar RNA-associated protein 11 [Nicrophorus vespilloides]|uniref:U3 small nucleolar RNA-associated protein 11 n=1 Tax=Nicrophorus vespilloides TaxID=110193 RepID=A0ABM1N919_NICVS|nr:PREDICTED: probable U3 small nucleolar RNA-associated protein 11 [Nicrophorus vespilloides]